ncbi:MAG: FxLYD domain-containing protein [Eggerthellaceae bacterium]|jgi:hypothetical protein
MKAQKLLGVIACILFVLCLAGCASGGSSSTSTDYADDEAMQIISKGWCQRSKLVDGLKSTDDDYQTKLKAAVQTEIDNDAALRNRPFENGQMQEDVIAYLNALDDSMDVLNNYSVGTLDYSTAWDKVYDRRTRLLKKFVNEYGFTVDSKYQDTLDKLVANGTAADMKANQKQAIDDLIANASWQTDESHGSYTYSAVIENTSDYDFKNVGLIVGLYDADGVKSENYANVNSWKKGEKVKFETHSSTSAERISAEVSYYDVAD